MNEADTQPRAFTLPERIRILKTLNAFGLGHVRLPGITIDTVCHGKQFGCGCPDCTAKPETAEPPALQPWEPRPARAA